MQKDDLSEADIARYWRKVDRREPDECWLWKGWTTHQGYGRLDVGRSKPLATHIALLLDDRPRPDAPSNLALHGDCSNPRCCNPSHLRWGSGLENAGDRERLGRRDAARGEKNGLAKLNEEAVRLIRSSPDSQRKLAAKLGVSQVLVGRVRKRAIWAHVT